MLLILFALTSAVRCEIICNTEKQDSIKTIIESIQVEMSIISKAAFDSIELENISGYLTCKELMDNLIESEKIYLELIDSSYKDTYSTASDFASKSFVAEDTLSKIDYMESSINLYPFEEYRLHYLGVLYMDRYRYSEAKNLFKMTIALNWDSPDAIILLNRITIYELYANATDRLLRSENAFNLCKVYYEFKLDKIKSELIRRKAINSQEWSLIDQHKIRIGMSEYGLVASWGKPEDTNRSIGSWGIHIQWIYQSAYVYTENGKIVSWQD